MEIRFLYILFGDLKRGPESIHADFGKMENVYNKYILVLYMNIISDPKFTDCGIVPCSYGNWTIKILL